MFTSRPSDPRTVLLWSDRWWLAGTDEPISFDHLAHAAEVLAAHFSDEPKPVRLRLIYQPDTLTSVTVACPQGNRKILAAALVGEFPALQSSDHAWSHEPIFAHGDGFSTVLHFESEPELMALASRLAQLGLAVDSAWPLATVLNALPDEWTDSGAVTVVAVAPERAIAYRHPRDGARSVQSWHSESTVVEVGQWLAGIFADNPDEPVIVVAAEDDTAARLESYLGEERPNLEWLRLAEALGRRIELPRYHPAQLLPREPVFTAQRAAIAASVALLLAGSWAGYSLGRERIVARSETAHRAAHVAVLRADIAHLRENAVEIAALRSLIEGGSASPPCGTFLRQLSTTVPRDIALSSVRITGRNVEFAGWVSPAAPPGVLDEWRNRLAPSDGPWAIVFRSSAGGAFTATGAFRS